MEVWEFGILIENEYAHTYIPGCVGLQAPGKHVIIREI